MSYLINNHFIISNLCFYCNNKLANTCSKFSGAFDERVSRDERAKCHKLLKNSQKLVLICIILPIFSLIYSKVT